MTQELWLLLLDLSQFIRYHPAERVIVTGLKAKEWVMKLMNHENDEVTKNALLSIQRFLLGAKHASSLQASSLLMGFSNNSVWFYTYTTCCGNTLKLTPNSAPCHNTSNYNYSSKKKNKRERFYFYFQKRLALCFYVN